MQQRSTAYGSSSRGKREDAAAQLEKSDPDTFSIAIQKRDGASGVVAVERGSEAKNDAKRTVFALIHGIPGSERDFRYLSPLLRKYPRCDVWRMVLPGFAGCPGEGVQFYVSV